MKKYLIEEGRLARIVAESARRIVEDIAGVPSEGDGGFDFGRYVESFGRPDGTETVSVMELDDHLNRFVSDDDAYEFINGGDESIDFVYRGDDDAICVEEDLCRGLASRFGEDALDELNRAITMWWHENYEDAGRRDSEREYMDSVDSRIDKGRGNY